MDYISFRVTYFHLNNKETFSKAKFFLSMTGGDHGINQIGKLRRVNSGGQILLHSLSTNDASLGEYKYTVNVGCHNIKITGDSLDLVRVSCNAEQTKKEKNLNKQMSSCSYLINLTKKCSATLKHYNLFQVSKLVLDEYFTSSEFLTSIEAGIGYDYSQENLSSISSVPSKIHIPIATMPSQQIYNPATSFIDNDVSQFRNCNEAEDDVFIIEDNENGMYNNIRLKFSELSKFLTNLFLYPFVLYFRHNNHQYFIPIS